MDAEYCAKSENRCIELFSEFNSHHNYYSTWTPTTPCSPYDVTATTAKGTECKIELKRRDMNSTQYSEYFIEADKLADGLMYALEGYKPLYINFFNDGKVLTWDLTNLKMKPNKNKRRRKNIGSGMNDCIPVYSLSVKDAHVSTF